MKRQWDLLEAFGDLWCPRRVSRGDQVCEGYDSTSQQLSEKSGSLQQAPEDKNCRRQRLDVVLEAGGDTSGHLKPHNPPSSSEGGLQSKCPFFFYKRRSYSSI